MTNNFFKTYFLVLIIIFVGNFSYGQIAKYSNDFLSIGVSAKSIAMGNSTVALTNDATSGYINPAGLIGLRKKYDLSLMHSEYFAGIAKYDYMSAGYKIDDSSAVAASLIRLGVDDIQNTLNLYDTNGNIDFDRVELFSVADYAFLLSYARKSKIQGLSYGANTKIIFRNQGEFATAFGFGIDAGLQYQRKKWLFGVVAKDITSTFNAWFFNVSDQMQQVFEQTGNEIPENSLEITMPSLTAGVAREFNFSKKMGLRSELDLVFTFDGKRNTIVSFNPVSIYPQAGLDFDYQKIVFLRFGVNNFQVIPDFKNLNSTETTNYYSENSLNFIPSMGLGLQLWDFTIDYALTDIGNQSIAIYSHVFSLKYRF